jgi:hypothetical protein
MNTNNDNDVATKKDIRLLEQSINESFDKKFDEKFDLKFDQKFKENFDKSFDKKFAQGFGVIKEHFDGVFKLTREYMSDTPRRTSVLETKVEENDEEHRNFRIRIGALERAVK